MRPRLDDPSPLSSLYDDAAGVLLANRPSDEAGANALRLGVGVCHQLEPAGRSQSQNERLGGGTYASG